MPRPTLADTLDTPRRRRPRERLPWWRLKRYQTAITIGLLGALYLTGSLCGAYGRCPPPEPPRVACHVCDTLEPMLRAAIALRGMVP